MVVLVIFLPSTSFAILHINYQIKYKYIIYLHNDIYRPEYKYFDDRIYKLAYLIIDSSTPKASQIPT